MNIVLLLSGGLDSAAALFSILESGHKVFPVALDYGQKASEELNCAAKLARYVGANLKVDTILGEFPASPLTTAHLPVTPVQSGMDSATEDYAPGLMPYLLAAGIRYGLSSNCDRLCMGLSPTSPSMFPNLDETCLSAINTIVTSNSHQSMRILVPLWKTPKATIIKMLAEIKAPFWMTHSCIAGDTHCGICHKCVLRKESFANSHSEDPTDYGL